MSSDLKNLLKKKKKITITTVLVLSLLHVLPQFTSSLFHVANQDYNFGDHSLFSHSLFVWLSSVILHAGHINQKT